MSHSNVGDPVELGICVGFGMEMCDRMGRLVGIQHNPDREIHRYIIREYAPGDGYFPTGRYCTTSIIGLTPHTPGPEGCKESSMVNARSIFLKDEAS